MATTILFPNTDLSNNGFVSSTTSLNAALRTAGDAASVHGTAQQYSNFRVGFDNFSVPAGNVITRVDIHVRSRMANAPLNYVWYSAQMQTPTLGVLGSITNYYPQTTGSYTEQVFGGTYTADNTEINNLEVYLIQGTIFADVGILYVSQIWAVVTYQPLPTPTAITPANLTTVSTSRPGLSANLAAATDGRPLYRQWQLATNNTFTTGVMTVTDSLASTTKSGSVNFPALPSRLAQGTWYIRARALDTYGAAGGYSAATSFTVSHVPTTANRTPTAGATFSWPSSVIAKVEWVFSDLDPEDFQTKYQVQMWKFSNPGTVLDSGVVTSANNWYWQMTGMDATWKDTEIRWRVKVWDQDNVASAWSPESSFFFQSPAVVTLTNPTQDQTITTPSPLITWSLSGLTLGRTQAQFRVDIMRGGVAVSSSGWIASNATQWQVPSPTVTVGPQHFATVYIIDSKGVAANSSSSFYATYSAPTSPSFQVSALDYPIYGRYTVDWSSATADPTFYSWSVYRRPSGTASWTLLFETKTVGIRSYRDYLAPSSVPMDYAVVQRGVSFDIVTESAYVPASVVATGLKYGLVCPTNDALNMVLHHVNGEQFGDEREVATFKIIGGGRRVEYGTRYGHTGSLDITLYDQFTETVTETAREQRLKFEALQNTDEPVYLRNPFGDVYRVALMTGEFTRVPGTGFHEVMTATIEYEEITE